MASMPFTEVVVETDGVSTIHRGGGSQGSKGSSWCHRHSQWWWVVQGLVVVVVAAQWLPPFTMVVGHPGLVVVVVATQWPLPLLLVVATSLTQMARWWCPCH